MQKIHSPADILAIAIRSREHFCFRERIILKKILFFLLLAAFTLISGLYVERYVDLSPEMLNGEFTADGSGTTGWQVRGDSNRVRINGKHITLGGDTQLNSVAILQRFNLFSGSRLLRLSGDISSEISPHHSAKGAVGLWSVGQYRASDSRRMASHVAGQLKGETPMQHYSVVFTPLKEESFLKVVLKLYHGAGVLHARDLSLKEVEQVWWYRTLQFFCLGLWGLFFITFIFPSYWGSNKGLGRVGLILAILMIVIIAGTSFPGSMKNTIDSGINRNLYRVERMCNRIITKVGFEWRLPVAAIRRGLPTKSTAAHFILFTSLAFGMVVALPNRSLPWAGVDILLLAAGSELIQFYVDGRTPYWGDFGVDLCGVASGFLVACGFILIRRGSRRRKSQAIEI